MSENTVENLKLTAGAGKAPIGIVPMHPLYGMARVLEDSACKYAPFNYMAQSLKDALESYDNAFLRHRIACTLLGGQVTPESYAAPDPDSGIPHIFHMIDGLMILATLMIRDGILKLDPGPGKRKQAKDAKVVADKVAFVNAWQSEVEYAARLDECASAGCYLRGHCIDSSLCPRKKGPEVSKAEELGAKKPSGGGSGGVDW